MDKITRIHIAKVPYEISIEAQERLTKYFNAIRKELDPELASETMDDIEVRITEILAERKIARNDVITLKDISAIQEQLGSPEQFRDEGAKTKRTHESFGNSRRLLRDKDGAYLGGVASGIGIYFGIDPIFIRILFALLTFATGIGILIYIVMWILVPAAESSSDKLQMSGQPVTAANLQQYRSSIRERLGNRPNNIQIAVSNIIFVLKKIVRVILTVMSSAAALYLLVTLVIGSSFTFVYPFRPIFVGYGVDYVALGLIWLVGLCLIGLLVAFVMRMWGNRSHRLKFGAISLLALLIVALAGSGGVGVVVYNHFSNQYGNGKISSALAVDDINTVLPSKLNVNSDNNLELNYYVTDQPIHATYEAYPGLSKPDITITNDSGTITVDSTNLAQAAPNCLGNLCKHIYLPVSVTIYGPAVATVDDNYGASVSINNANLGNSISINANNGSGVYLDNDYVTTMNISATHNSSVYADSSNAHSATINVDSSSIVTVPVTDNLSLSVPNDCNMDNMSPVNLGSYSGSIVLNGKVVNQDAISQNTCIN